MINWLILISYFIGSFIFLYVIEKRIRNVEDEAIRKQQIDSGMIICSILWLPLIFFVAIYVLIKRIFE